jgi:hypothetical protein
MTRWFKYGLSAVILCISLTLSAQINFTQAPKDGAFLARNLKSNVAKYEIEGTVTDNSYTSLTVEVYRDNSLIYTYPLNLNFSQGKALFNRPIALKAGKYSYTIKYILTGSANSWSTQVDNIQVGDVYIIQGQSNAVASNFSGSGVHANAYKDKYIRSFGTASNNSLNSGADSFWHDADGDISQYRGSIGQWGLVLAKSLLDSFNIPICILNGGVGGTRISQHQRDPYNYENLNTIYGRLLSRVKKAELNNHIRGIFYYQGESDGPYALHHDTLFKKLHGFWSEDFPNFEKLYVVQVREGCGNPSMQLREFQRQFEFNLPNCQTISSNGLDAHDGCHFKFEKGYRKLGMQLAALAGRDFYNSSRTKNIDPPNIKDCYYSNATKTEITLNLIHADDDIVVDTGFYTLFQIEGDPTVKVTKGSIIDNQIVLELNKSSCLISGLSYNGLRLVQPWVKNKIGTALISFYNQPIKYHRVLGDYKGCKNSSLTLGEDSISGSLYKWTRFLTNQNYTSSKINIMARQAELFSLIISYPKSNCKSNDTLRIRMSPESITLPNLGRDTLICQGDSLMLKADSTTFTEPIWHQNGLIKRVYLFNTNVAGPIILNIKSPLDCIYKDTINLNVYNGHVKLPDDFSICPGLDTVLKTNREYSQYTWNGVEGNSQYRTSASKVLLTVKDSFGCQANDSINILEQNIPSIPKLNIDVCSNSFVSVPKPANFTSWFIKDTVIFNNLNVYSNQDYPITLIDAFGCLQKDTIYTNTLPAPYYTLGIDTGFCKNSSIILPLPQNMAKYYVNGKEHSQTQILINKPGKLYTSVIDNNACSHSDTVSIVEYSLPSLNQFYDTIVCVNKPVGFKLESGLNYYVNSVLINETYTFNDSGNYTIMAQNMNGCQDSKNINVSYKPCINGINNIIESQLTIFPNPSHGQIIIESARIIKDPIYLCDMNGKVIYQSVFTGRKHFIDAGAFEKGIYILKIKTRSFKIILY